jgi:hypothetical protein
MIIPYKNLVRGIHRVRPTPNESQNVTSEQHLHHAYPPTREVSPKRLLERVAVIDPEPSACSASEAAIILVEGDGEEIGIHPIAGFEIQPIAVRGRGRGRRRRLCCGNGGLELIHDGIRRHGDLCRGSKNWGRKHTGPERAEERRTNLSEETGKRREVRFSALLRLLCVPAERGSRGRETLIRQARTEDRGFV